MFIVLGAIMASLEFYFTGSAVNTAILTLAAGAAPAECFSAEQWPAVKVMMQSIWNNEMMDSELKRACPIFNCITEKQNIDISQEVSFLLDGQDCRGITVVWLNACDLDVEDCDAVPGAANADDCKIDGPEICSKSESYVPNYCKKKSFSVVDSSCKTKIDKQQRIAKGFAMVMAALEQAAEKQMIVNLIQNADDITNLDLPTGAVIGSTIWEIDKDKFNPELIVEFMCLLDLISMSSACMVTGKNFYGDYIKKEKREGNGCCHFDALLDQFKVCANIRDVDQLAGSPSTFLVAPGALAFVNRNVYMTPTPKWEQDDHNTRTWYVTSQKLFWYNGATRMPVRFDVKHQRKCCGDNLYKECFEVKHRGIFMASPLNCFDNLRGIIHIQATCADC